MLIAAITTTGVYHAISSHCPIISTTSIFPQKALSTNTISVNTIAEGTSDEEKTNSIHTGTLTIKITNITIRDGTARIAVFNTKTNWLKQPVYSQALEINDKNCDQSSCTWKINNAHYGDYGIAIYHDVNRNKKLDTNILGIPKENYGFSNNQRGMFGSPKWHKAKFILDKNKTEHTVMLN